MVSLLEGAEARLIFDPPLLDPPVRPGTPELVDYNFETDPVIFLNQTGTDKRNFLEGDGGRDWLVGRGGNDSLLAKGGRDYLEGSNGNDTLSGGGDSMVEDRFAFDRNDGSDIITDFHPQCTLCIDIFPGPEGDRILLLGGTDEDIAAVTSGVTEADGNAVLHYGNTTITMQGIEADRVAENWFLIG